MSRDLLTGQPAPLAWAAVSTPFLSQAVAEAHERVRAARPTHGHPGGDLGGLVEPAGAVDRPSFAAALRAPGLSVIAEVKRASPSRGRIADIPDPAGLAAAYVDGGAAAVSVLTEPRHFLGSLADLEAVADRVAAPVLRKDFIVDPWQLREARLHGAAAALLIVAALTDDDLVVLLRAAAAFGLDVLVETHDAAEVARAVRAHAASRADLPLIIGVNARNLQTLAVDLGVVERTAAELPRTAVLVAESGVRGPADAARMAAAGAHAVLVGEHVAMAEDPAAAVAALRRAAPDRTEAVPTGTEST